MERTRLVMGDDQGRGHEEGGTCDCPIVFSRTVGRQRLSELSLQTTPGIRFPLFRGAAQLTCEGW